MAQHPSSALATLKQSDLTSYPPLLYIPFNMSQSRGAPSKATQRVQRYVQYEAYLNPSAQSLATELKMPLCTPTAPFPGLMPFLDRLVTTGRDTPNNMAAWFGPHWEEGTREMHHQARLATLSAPWPPSPYINVYVNFHALGRPRPPTKEEQAELKAMLDYSTRPRH